MDITLSAYFIVERFFIAGELPEENRYTQFLKLKFVKQHKIFYPLKGKINTKIIILILIYKFYIRYYFHIYEHSLEVNYVCR